MLKNKVTFKILFLLIICDIFETAIHFFFKKSALAQSSKAIVDIASALDFLKATFGSPYLWLGLFFVVAVFIIWSMVLTKIDLSVAVPIASFSYILIPLVSIIFLHEQITVLRWLGVFLVLIGVIFVSLSSKERLEQAK
ncbi:MAG: EamA family transporter [Candidatus Omnitrophota bacterium]